MKSITKLAGILNVILPKLDYTLFLQTCLLTGDAGEKAWQAWKQKNQEPLIAIKKQSQPYKRHLPLLYYGLIRNEIKISNTLQTVLRTAVMREQLRNKTYERILYQTLDVLHKVNIRPFLLKGSVTASIAYPHPSLRHCHDIDLFIRSMECKQAIMAFKQANLRLISSDVQQLDIELKHPSGLPVFIHRNLFANAVYNRVQNKMLVASKPLLIMNKEVNSLNFTDLLLHICGHAATSSSCQSLTWVYDAYFLLQQFPQIDWQNLLDNAKSAGFSLPLWVMLQYLQQSFQSPVPEAFLSELVEQVTSPTEEIFVLLKNSTGRHKSLRYLLKLTQNHYEKFWLIKELGPIVLARKIKHLIK
ncbi:nucleotidyltransferase family protein [Thermosynechococcaceae cyanobacterium BACA0444]|uniref:Nucleotidyltransferase family protein n=1 Tax=Pseudocalidococcus azoricus BACA0444 TaxID=2918990 RepID=A0AAE4K0V9_9CYAN|nr:nucleotidyltransferase family protein [Pseudocalidococcus azoricus]MDS3862227.1 nucleotidyltransferase family protein [Pseudocalidococcus azoricus BACA0444]